MTDVIVNKIQSIQRCVRRAREEYERDPEHFESNYTMQDAALLNVLRACEQAIDLANTLNKSHRLGIPSTSGESFELLAKAGIIDLKLSDRLRKMVGFRNTVIHNYQRTEMDVVRWAIETGLQDLVEFGDRVLVFEGSG